VLNRYKYGGAIGMTGLPGSSAILQEMVFERNAVQVPMDGSTIDITVLLYT